MIPVTVTNPGKLDKCGISGLHGYKCEGERMEKDTLKLMRKYGKIENPGSTPSKATYSVICQGCGKLIKSTDEVEPGWAETKRGTAMFWHPGCEAKIDANRILWRKP